MFCGEARISLTYTHTTQGYGIMSTVKPTTGHTDKHEKALRHRQPGTQVSTASTMSTIGGGVDTAKSCIAVKGVKAETARRHCLRDLTTARIKCKNRDGTTKVMIVASAYFPYDAADSTPKEVVVLMRECDAKETNLVLGCDTNVHHMV